MTSSRGRLWAAFFIALALTWLLAIGARAQGVVEQMGPTTTGHLIMGLGRSALVLDAGGPATTNGMPRNNPLPGTLPTGLGIVNSGLGNCQWTGYANSAYGQFCTGFDGSGNALISLSQIGGTLTPNLIFDLNGVNFSFPGPGNGNVAGPNSPTPTAGNLAYWNGSLTLADSLTPLITVEQHVTTNAALAAAKIAAYPRGVWRDGFTLGSAPPLYFNPSSSACPLNGGNGDGGTQVKSADATPGCWLAVLPAVLDAREFGTVGNGVTDDTAALLAASAAAQSTGLPLHLAGLQYGVTAFKVYATTKTIWGPGACLVQLGDGNVTLATLPSPGAAPGDSNGIWLDHPCVHINGHLSAGMLFEQAQAIRFVSPFFDGVPAAACTFTHDDGVNHSGTYPCAGILIKAITGGPGGPSYWHGSDAHSDMPLGSVVVSGIGTDSFSFTGAIPSGATIGDGNAVGDMTAPGGQIPAGTTVTNVSAQVSGTVTLSGPHTIQIGDTVQFTTGGNPAIWLGTTAGQTTTRPNFGVLDGRSRIHGYNLAVWDCAGSDNEFHFDLSSNTIGFENGGCGINVSRNRVVHPYLENIPIYGVWNTTDSAADYGNGLRIEEGWASTGGTFTNLFDQARNTSNPGSRPAARPNLLVNGAFDFDQVYENGVVTLVEAAQTPGPDGWEAEYNNNSGAFSVARVAEGPPGTGYGWRATTVTGATASSTSNFALRNVATGGEIADVGFAQVGGSLCQSFLAASSLSGTFGAYVMNAAGTRAYAWPFTLVGGAPLQKFSNCFPADFSGSFSATASISATTMTVTGSSGGELLVGDAVTGSGVTANTTILAQLTGTAFGNGTYTVSQSQTVGSELLTIGDPWTVPAPTRALLAGVSLGDGATNQIMPEAWTSLRPQQRGIGILGESTAMLTTTGATFDVTQMKLEISDQPTDYVHEPRAVQLGRVQARYWKNFPQGIAVGNSADASGVSAACKIATSATAGSWSLNVGPTVPMLGNGHVVTTYNPGANNANIRDVTAGSDAVVVPIFGGTAIGDTQVQIAEQTTALNVGDNYCIFVTIDRRP